MIRAERFDEAMSYSGAYSGSTPNRGDRHSVQISRNGPSWPDSGATDSLCLWPTAAESRSSQQGRELLALPTLASFGPSTALGFHPWRAISSATAGSKSIFFRYQLWLQSAKSRRRGGRDRALIMPAQPSIFLGQGSGPPPSRRAGRPSPSKGETKRVILNFVTVSPISGNVEREGGRQPWQH